MRPDYLAAAMIGANGGGRQLSREVFGNIPGQSKTLFYLLAVAAILVFGIGCYRRARLWMIGRRSNARLGVREFIHRFLCDVLFQRRVWGRGLASAAHILLFSGFVVLLIGTTLIAIEHLAAAILGRDPNNPVFHKGVYYAAYEVVLDAFGLAMLIGTAMLAKRRLRRPTHLSHNALDWFVLGGLFAIGVTGYLTEGLRIIHDQTMMPGFSFVGALCASLWNYVGINANNASVAHLTLWWIHAVLALGLVAAFPYTRLLHVIAGTINLSLNDEPLGVMTRVSIEEVEETGIIGVGSIEHLSRRQLLMLDACVSCGRCDDYCPALEAGKPLSPKQVVQDLRLHLNGTCRSAFTSAGTAHSGNENDGAERSLHGEVISSETIWSCTTCSACVDVCPLGVSPLGMITDMRRYLIAEAGLRGPPASALQKSQRTGNPWGLPPEERFDWAEGLNVPTVAENPDFEILYWVGCAASYDRRAQKVARAVVKLLKAAEVKFAVLGNQERCTGETARRMGDEFLFQELAESNLNTFQSHRVKKIVTHCPHCLNSFKNDYSQFGCELDVQHHSQLLAELLDAGALPIDRTRLPGGKLTYHDPCYLARVNNIVAPPRQLLTLSSAVRGMTEMPRRGRNTACCGAGGGRMWFDDKPDERIGSHRVNEALATGAQTIAVSCPFCLTMMTDGVAARESKVQVMDIAEYMVNALVE